MTAAMEHFAEAIVGLHAAAAVLLLVAGTAKIARPSSAPDPLRALRIPAAGWLPSDSPVLAVGMIEVGVGVAALAIGGPLIAGVVGGLYIVFAVTTLRANMVGAASCGCFGRLDTPPTWIHPVGNLVLSAASFLAIGRRTPVQIMKDQPAGGIGFVVIVGLMAGLLLVLFTVAPRLFTRPDGFTRSKRFTRPERSAGADLDSGS